MKKYTINAFVLSLFFTTSSQVNTTPFFTSTTLPAGMATSGFVLSALLVHQATKSSTKKKALIYGASAVVTLGLSLVALANAIETMKNKPADAS